MSILSDIGEFFEDLWDKFGGFLHDDVKPAFKIFFQQFAGHEGALIFRLAVKYAPQLASGKFGDVSVAMARELIQESAVIAAQDFSITLQQVQSALQVEKVAQNIQTPSDQVLVANVAATEKTIAG